MSEIIVIIITIQLIQQIDLKIIFVLLSNKIRTITVLIIIIIIKVFRKMITITTLIKSKVNRSKSRYNILLLINSTIFHIKIEFINQTN